MMISEEQPIASRTKFWTVTGIIISWLTIWIFIFSPFGLIAWIGILIYLMIKGSKLTWYFLLSAWLFVPGCSFLKGTVRYATGTASVISIGGPIMFDGMDRETRVPSISSGCIFVGYEPFVFPANNAAVRLCTDLFGFQKGAYTGFFPTEKDAEKILASGDTFLLKRQDNLLEFNREGQTLNLDIAYVYHSFATEDTVLGKVIKNECFIFKKKYQEGEETKDIYIVDIQNKKLLEIYSGNY